MSGTPQAVAQVDGDRSAVGATEQPLVVEEPAALVAGGDSQPEAALPTTLSADAVSEELGQQPPAAAAAAAEESEPMQVEQPKAPLAAEDLPAPPQTSSEAPVAVEQSAAVEVGRALEAGEVAPSADASTHPKDDVSGAAAVKQKRKPLLLSAAAAKRRKGIIEPQDEQPAGVKLSARGDPGRRREESEEPQRTLRRRRKVFHTVAQDGDRDDVIEDEETAPRKRKKVRRQREDDVERLRELIRAVYERNNPAKLAKLEELLQTKYVGHELDVYLHICRKYGEPPDTGHAAHHRNTRGAILLQPRGAHAKARPPKKPTLGVTELRSRIRSIYERHNPAKLDKINSLLEKYAGAELEMYEQACAKYGEEPLMQATPEEITAKQKSFVARKATAPPPPALHDAPSTTKRGAKALAFLHGEIEDAADTFGRGWPFAGEEFSGNSSSESWGSDNEHPVVVRGAQGNNFVDIYSDLGRSTRTGTDATVGTAWVAEARRDPVTLETFLGNWRDSMGNDVMVRWAPPDSRGGPLDVSLSRPSPSGRGPEIKLGVKAQGGGRFVCGHYDLDVEKSSTMRVVWLDSRTNGKSSVWERLLPHHGSAPRFPQRRNDDNVAQPPRERSRRMRR
jgi:hypothetical protein